MFLVTCIYYQDASVAKDQSFAGEEGGAESAVAEDLNEVPVEQKNEVEETIQPQQSDEGNVDMELVSLIKVTEVGIPYKVCLRQRIDLSQLECCVQQVLVVFVV